MCTVVKKKYHSEEMRYYDIRVTSMRMTCIVLDFIFFTQYEYLNLYY